MQILIELCVEFMKLGFFSYGGGLVILTLLQQKSLDLHWLTSNQFADIISISQSTPGPIAINLATFVGYLQGGFVGSLVATIAVALPGFAISVIVGKFMSHFDEKPIVKAILKGLRSVVIGLIATAIINIAITTIIDLEAYKLSKSLFDLFELKSVVLLIIITILTLKYKKHPFYYIIPAGVLGMIIWH